MNKAIVIGDDAVNALGLVQSLGREGVHVISVLDCKKSMLIRRSRYAKEIICVDNFDEAIDVILQRCVFDEPAVIFPAGDGAALTIEKNKNRLQEKFLFEHIDGEKNIEFYMNKQNQIKLAERYGLYAPESFVWRKGDDIPQNNSYPCIIKPLVSCEGDKRDILIASDSVGFKDILTHQLKFSDDFIIQQYIDKDYEYDMMGCVYENGTVYMPLSNRMVKFNHLLQDTSTISYIEPLDSEIAQECQKLKILFKEIGYVGLFSVEFMHNKLDQKIYFTEINFRNDGENAFIVHCGINLPFLHYLDLCKLPLKEYTPIQEPKKYIWEGIHFSGLMKHNQSFGKWFKDFKGVDGFMYYFHDDKKPFYYQFVNKLLTRIHK